MEVITFTFSGFIHPPLIPKIINFITTQDTYKKSFTQHKVWWKYC